MADLTDKCCQYFGRLGQKKHLKRLVELAWLSWFWPSCLAISHLTYERFDYKLIVMKWSLSYPIGMFPFPLTIQSRLRTFDIPLDQDGIISIVEYLPR
jgi:hypothetical protein